MCALPSRTPPPVCSVPAGRHATLGHALAGPMVRACTADVDHRESAAISRIAARHSAVVAPYARSARSLACAERLLVTRHLPSRRRVRLLTGHAIRTDRSSDQPELGAPQESVRKRAPSRASTPIGKISKHFEEVSAGAASKGAPARHRAWDTSAEAGTMAGNIALRPTGWKYALSAEMSRRRILYFGSTKPAAFARLIKTRNVP